MEKFSVDATTCQGCGLCETACGFNKGIAVHDGKARYNAGGNCIECLQCFKICPTRAINTMAKTRQTYSTPMSTEVLS